MAQVDKTLVFRKGLARKLHTRDLRSLRPAFCKRKSGRFARIGSPQIKCVSELRFRGQYACPRPEIPKEHRVYYANFFKKVHANFCLLPFGMNQDPTLFRKACSDELLGEFWGWISSSENLLCGSNLIQQFFARWLFPDSGSAFRETRPFARNSQIVWRESTI